MSATELISVPLNEEELAIIDARAKSHGVTREEMIVKLMRVGFPMVERQAQEMPDRGNEGKP